MEGIFISSVYYGSVYITGNLKLELRSDTKETSRSDGTLEISYKGAYKKGEVVVIDVKLIDNRIEGVRNTLPSGVRSLQDGPNDSVILTCRDSSTDTEKKITGTYKMFGDDGIFTLSSQKRLESSWVCRNSQELMDSSSIDSMSSTTSSMSSTTSSLSTSYWCTII